MPRTDFEIRHEDIGFRVYAMTTWGKGDSSTAGGLVAIYPFGTQKRAIAWVHEQFSVPETSWLRAPDGSIRARKVASGDDRNQAPASDLLFPDPPSPARHPDRSTTEMDDRLLERGSATGYRLGTLIHAFGRVARGEDPWLALGDLLDDWRRAEDDQRELMIATRIELASSVEEHLRRWAALFVGIADCLCWQNEPRLTPPDWLHDDSFRLADPWFVVPGDMMQIWQLVHSPTPLRMRNVFVDPSVMSRA